MIQQPTTLLPLPLSSTTSESQKWHNLTTRTSPPSLVPFYYGVRATKIYCRPTCPARLARRANVIYFDSLNAAVSAGYRACKRCRPDDMLFIGEAEEVVMRAMGVIGRLQGKNGKGGQGEQGEKQGLEDIAKQTGVSRSYLCRVFKKTMGMTVGDYIREFEKEGKGLVDEASTEKEIVQTLGEMKSQDAVSPSQKKGWDVRSDPTEDHMLPDIDAEFDYGQWICTENLTCSSTVESI